MAIANDSSADPSPFPKSVSLRAPDRACVGISKWEWGRQPIGSAADCVPKENHGHGLSRWLFRTLGATARVARIRAATLDGAGAG